MLALYVGIILYINYNGLNTLKRAKMSLLCKTHLGELREYNSKKTIQRKVRDPS